MSQGQGSVTFSGSNAASGGSSFPAIGAKDGLTIENDYVVLGNLATDVTDPAELMDNRRLQMQEFVFYFAFNNDQAWNWGLNDQSEGGTGNTIPMVWRSPAASYWSAWQPSNYGENYSPGGTANRFYSGYDIYSGVNPDSPRPNVVGMFWGYNTDYEQGQIDATEASFRYATETFFEIDDDYYFELHTPEITTTSGDIFRLDSTYVSRTTGIGFRELVINDLSQFDTTHNPNSGYFFMDLSYSVGSDTARLILRSQESDGVTEIIMGNWIDGNAVFVVQDNNFTIAASTLILLESETLYFVPTNYCVFVNPIVVNDSVGASPGGGSILDLQSTTLGFSPPKMTTVERNAIVTSSSTALLVFVTDIAPNGKLSLWTGVSWEIVTSV